MFTGLLIALLAIVGAATVVSGGLVVLARRTERQLHAGDEPLLLTAGDGAPIERGIREIRVDDIVQHDGADFLVEGVIGYDEDGHRWRSARLVDGRKVRWLMIGLERGGANSLRWLEEDPAVEINGYPPEQLRAGGDLYSQQSRGNATARVAGEAGELADTDADGDGTDSVLRCRWWRYEAAGGKALILEQWGARYRALRGRLIRKTDIDMMPGS